MDHKDELHEFHRLSGLRLYHRERKNKEIDEIPIDECYRIALHFVISWEVARESDYDAYSSIMTRTGWHAYASFAFNLSLEYFQIAVKFATTQEDKKMLDLLIIRINYALMNHEQCLELVDEALAKYTTKLDCAKFLAVKAKSLFGLNRLDEGLDCCFEALEKLDKHVPSKPEDEPNLYTALQNELIPNIPSSVTEILKLPGLPACEDERVLLIHEIFTSMVLPLLLSKRRLLLKYLCFDMVLLMLKFGTSIYCATPLILVASYEVCSPSKNLRKSIAYCNYAFSLLHDMSLETNEQFGLAYRLYCFKIGSLVEPLETISRAYDIYSVSSLELKSDALIVRFMSLRNSFSWWFASGLNINQMMKKFKNFFTFLFSGDDDADTIKAGQIAYDCAMKYLKELSGGDGSYALFG
ncbi:unnamed protein product [Ambrosiozyma monospora]|uniref:Unnamed protein product n=1 Tax=Ambrosiozyma monospora TaxID=43982 RepID=A0ACB5TSG6_AMBMO|nr:unnamed protein product [Ambrosiozyma monospora]